MLVSIPSPKSFITSFYNEQNPENITFPGLHIFYYATAFLAFFDAFSRIYYHIVYYLYITYYILIIFHTI